MAEEEITDAEKKRMQKLITIQKVALGILLKWMWLFAVISIIAAVCSTAYLLQRGAKSVKRYTASTRLLYNPRKVAKIEPMNDKQLMSILERPSLKRRIADLVPMPPLERACLGSDVEIVQERRPSNLFTLKIASQSMKTAVLKANAYAEILIDEYAIYRKKDLDNWRQSVADRHKLLMEQLSEIEAAEKKLSVKTGIATPQEALLAINALISDQRRNLSALGVDTANEELKRRKLEASVGKSGAAIIENASAIRNRTEAIAVIDKELVTLRERYTDLNPKVVGKLEDRAKLVKDLQQFLDSKGVASINIDNIDSIEKSAGDLADCVTRIEALGEKRRALEQEIKDNEKRASELTAMIPDFERLHTQHEDIEKSMRDLNEQLGDIAYITASLKNDLRQIERAVGAGDQGPLGPKRLILAVIGTVICCGVFIVWVLAFEFRFGRVRGGSEISAYSDITYLGSLPKENALPQVHASEVMGVVVLKLMNAQNGIMLVCELPGAKIDSKFDEALDYTASMSGMRGFTLNIVSSGNFNPPEDAEQMIGVVKKDAVGWFSTVNRYAIAPTELQMLQADLAELRNSFDMILVRMEDGVRKGGTFFDQLLGVCDAAILVVGVEKTPRKWFWYVHRHVEATGKPMLAISTNATSAAIRKEMEAKV